MPEFSQSLRKTAGSHCLGSCSIALKSWLLPEKHERVVSAGEREPSQSYVTKTTTLIRSAPLLCLLRNTLKALMDNPANDHSHAQIASRHSMLDLALAASYCRLHKAAHALVCVVA
eukprot:TRINITY_DN13364_c0_g1_i1.p1 TRINITY_DN13364_c0_g1~~TRINITY_DN13364_c0_g1_i1.p1  ORF type:complete len:116 (-),score=5.00 TRINITY_DN13364_c0_g1_i1:155-502(-)